eukprot:2348975-Amphidinium_carterae.1
MLGPHSFKIGGHVALISWQTLCALGQPLLVNLTSEMGAEWFPPNERCALSSQRFLAGADDDDDDDDDADDADDDDD